MKLPYPCICMVCFLLFALPALASGPSLCREDESIVYQCALENKKIVAVCVHNDRARDEFGPALYRYGTPDHIELTLPEDPKDFMKVASYDQSGSMNPTTEQDAYARFINGQFSYLIYHARGYRFEIQGLAVFDGQRLLSNTHCRSWQAGSPEGAFVLLNVPKEEKTKAWLFWKKILPPGSVVRAHKPPSASTP